MEKNNSKITNIIKITIPFVMAYFIYPEANKEYSGFFFGGFTGAVHGATLINNYIYSFFDPSHLLKAQNCSGWYSFSWWASAISSILSLITIIIGIFGFGLFSIFSLFKKTN